MSNSINVSEFLTKKVKAYIKHFDAVAFFLTFALSILVHAFMFTNKFFNHDDLGAMFIGNGIGISSGRWALQFFFNFTGAYMSPWVIGVISSVLLGVTVVFLVHIFKIRHYPSLFCVSLLFVAFPSVASTFCYMSFAVPYLFALLLSVVCAYFIKQKEWWKIAIGIVSLAISLGIYQTYICLTLVLLFFSFMVELISSSYNGRFLPIIKDVAKYLVSIVLSLVLYYVILKICLAVTGQQLEAYQGISGMFDLNGEELLKRFDALFEGNLLYITNGYGIYNPIFTKLVITGFALDLIAMAYLVVKNKIYKKPWYLVTLGVWLLAFPLALGCAYLLTSENVHQVMKMYMVSTFILPAILADRIEIKVSAAKIKKALSVTLVILMLGVQLLLGHEFVLVTNRCYLSMDITYSATLSYFTRVIDKIESLDGFSPDCHIVLIGNPNTTFNIPHTNITGDNVDFEALKMYSRYLVIQRFAGGNYPISDEGPVGEQIRQTEEFAEMPCYPADNSIQMIDGKIVVKFSE